MTHYHDSISTVQLSPFGEDQWNRIVTYSPIYLHWTDLVVTPQKRTRKSISAKRRLVNTVNFDAIQFDDELLLDEIQQMRRAAVRPRSKEKSLYGEAKFLDEEYGRRTTSPEDNYRKETDLFHQIREPLLAHPRHNSQRPLLQGQTSRTTPMKVLPDIDFGPKPRESLGVQLRQSTMTRQHALASSTDHQVISPLTMCSSRRPVGSAHSSRRANQQNRVTYSQTPQTTETKVLGGLYEQVSTNSSSTRKKAQSRSTNTSRSNIHMVKTKNDRTRQKQLIELKTVLVQPCRQPISEDSGLEQAIPNSIELMRTVGGPISAFESSLRYNYHRQLNQFRNGSTKR